jgi:NADH-quinone oxidoreductase subunit N
VRVNQNGIYFSVPSKKFVIKKIKKIKMDFSILFQNNLKMFLPEIFLATSILILTLHGSFIVSSRHLGFPLIVKSISKLSILILLLTVFLSNNNSINFMLTYQNTFMFDLLTYYVKEIILISVLFCIFIFENSIIRNQINNFEYFILLLSATLGLLLLVSSYDFLSLYLAIEMQSLCLYVLAGAKKNSSFSTDAGIKYFILGSFSSALLLFGISFIYGCAGTTNFDNLSILLAQPDSTNTIFSLNSLIEKALLCIAAAFLFKIAAAPFHMWSPDVYEGSPTSSTIFFAVVPKIALFAIFLRIFQYIFFIFEDVIVFALILFSMASVIVGSFVALKQKKLKRLLAYSSISHVGYLLLAFASNSLEATVSLFFYLVIYMLTSISIWSIVLSLNTIENQKLPKTLIDLSAIAVSNPILGFSAMIAFFSLAGVPPLAGFLAKMEIFTAALGASLFFPSFVAILSSVISSYYYIRIVKTIYFEKNQRCFFIFPVSYSCALTTGISTFFLIFFFINPTLVLLITQKMALCLF